MPLLETSFDPALSGGITIRRSYAELDSVGTDAAIPLHWFTIKAESAFFRSNTPPVDQYVLYVLQAERQYGEWLFVAGYIGDYITNNRNEVNFDPERGLAKAFVGRSSWTIDTSRSLVFEGAAKQSGDGFYGKIEYSQAFGQHWCVTPRIGVIRGSDNDFLGHYHRNSFASLSLSLRHSF